MEEPVVLSWGCQEDSGMSISLVRHDEKLVLTITAPAASLKLEKFAPTAEGGVLNSD